MQHRYGEVKGFWRFPHNFHIHDIVGDNHFVLLPPEEAAWERSIIILGLRLSFVVLVILSVIADAAIYRERTSVHARQGIKGAGIKVNLVAFQQIQRGDYVVKILGQIVAAQFQCLQRNKGR